MAFRRQALMLLPIWSLCSVIAALEYHIVGLVPLSGTHAARGRAQWRGMTLAVQETLHTVNDVIGVRASFTHNDTAGDSIKENETIARYWENCEAPSCILAVVGGTLDTRLPETGQHRLPQILLEAQRREEPGRATFPLSVRPQGDSHVYTTLARVSEARGWDKVVLVIGRDHADTECAEKELGRENITITHTIVDRGSDNVINILRSTRLRVVILCLDQQRASDVVCRSLSRGVSRRYIWLYPVQNASTSARTLQSTCGQSGGQLSNIFLFEQRQIEINTKVSQVFNHVTKAEPTLAADVTLRTEAAFAYDATRILLNGLRAVRPSALSKPRDGREIVDRIWREISSRRWTGVTGIIQFDKYGNRKLQAHIYTFSDDNRLTSVGMDGMIAEEPTVFEGRTDGAIRMEVTLQGVPLSLFVVMCALAGLGIAYALALVGFNIAQRKDRTIKMTSPNINVVSLLACCGGYSCMVMMGLDTTRGISVETMQKLMQAVIYVLVIGFTLLYGAVFTKSWRVFTIFKNLNANGKVTRDEHLLLGVFFMIVLDLVILLPWHFLDPIICSRRQISEIYDHANLTDVVTEVDVCGSRQQDAWVAAVYCYKALLLALGFLFAWQTRRVTLPALKDTHMIHLTIGTVVAMSLVALPVILDRAPGGGIMSYATGAMIIWIVVTIDITLLFLPKVILYWRESRRVTRGESFRFQFSESMKRTQDALRRMMACLCCGEAENDKYAHEMLVTEIETLKRTIKDKDNTIRELTDRLYMGADRFQQYLRNPHRQQDSLADIQHRPTGSPLRGQNTGYMVRQPSAMTRESRSLNVEELYDLAVDNPHGRDRRSQDRIRRINTVPSRTPESLSRPPNGGVYSIDRNNISSGRTAIDVHTPVSRRNDSNWRYDQTQTAPRTPSPNFDSAFENTSPSSDNSDRSMHNPQWQGGNGTVGPGPGTPRRPVDVQRERIDLEAMEKEVAPPTAHTQRPNSHRPREYSRPAVTTRSPASVRPVERHVPTMPTSVTRMNEPMRKY